MQRQHRAVARVDPAGREAKRRTQVSCTRLVGHHLGRRALADDAAGIEAHDALAETHHRLHDVLDHDDGDALGVQPAAARPAPRRPRHSASPAIASSEINRLRPRGHGARQLHLAQLDLAQLAGWRVPLWPRARSFPGSPAPRPADWLGPIARAGARRNRAPPAGFPRTVMLRNGRGTWNERAMPRWVRLKAGRRVMSSPAKRTVPPSLQASTPEMQLIRVVLPEPLGPIRPKRSPVRIVDRDVLERGEAAEPLGHAIDLEERFAHGWLFPPMRARARR